MDTEPATAVGALAAADAATRMGGRRHPILRAAILSAFNVRAVELATLIHRGLGGEDGHPLFSAMIRDFCVDLDHARTSASRLRPRFDGLIRRDHPLFRARIQAETWPADAPARLALIRDYDAALNLTREFVRAIDGLLATGLDLRLNLTRDLDLDLACELATGLEADIDRAIGTAYGWNTPGRTVEQTRTALDMVRKRTSTLDTLCAQGAASRLGILPVEGLAAALLDGAMDDFTHADLTYASLAYTDLIGVRWTLSGTTWPPGTNVTKILARSEKDGPGDVLVITRRVVLWPS